MLRRRPLLLASWVAGLPGVASGQPVVVECQWELHSSIAINNPASVVCTNEWVYVTVRDAGAADGLYRVWPDGRVIKVVDADRPGGVELSRVDGCVFVAEDYSGNIYKVPLGSNERTLWVSGFRPGDDDPVGIAVLPGNYAGPVGFPGEVLSADRGVNGGYDDIWMWAHCAPEGEVLLHSDDGTLVDAVDIAVNERRVIVVDDRGDPGALWEVVDSSGTLAEVVTSIGISHPKSAVFDSMGDDLLVASSDATASKVVRVRLARGVAEVSDVIVGFGPLHWGSIDIQMDGQVLWVADRAGMVYRFVRLGFCPPDFNHDCYVNTLDVLAFLNAWTAREPEADFNADGAINTMDVLAFLNAWNAGC